MGILRGLNSADKLNARSNTPGVRWLKVEDGKSVKIRIANAGSEDAPDYDENRGAVLLIKEHVNPENFTKSAECTMEDEGRCFGCEMHQRDFKAGWRPKVRMYTNVIVEAPKEEPYVAVWGLGAGPKATTFSTIRDYAEDNPAITATTWKLKRSGANTETTYSILPGTPDSEPFDFEPFNLFDLELAVRRIPYADQEAYYSNVKAATLTETTSGEW